MIKPMSNPDRSWSIALVFVIVILISTAAYIGLVEMRSSPSDVTPQPVVHLSKYGVVVRIGEESFCSIHLTNPAEDVADAWKEITYTNDWSVTEDTTAGTIRVERRE